MAIAQYNSEALNGAMTAAQSQESTFNTAADQASAFQAEAAAYGQLDQAGALATALNTFADNLATEFGTAGQRLNGVARALDAVETSVQNVEDNTVHEMSVQV